MGQPRTLADVLALDNGVSARNLWQPPARPFHELLERKLSYADLVHDYSS